MRVKMNKRIYDTRTAQLAWDISADDRHIKKIYIKRNGEFFLYKREYTLSNMTCEMIKPITEKQTRKLIEQ